ncbi:MAG: hypothetical protein WBO31_05835 [Saprospiraceae bacterium]|nr:hypothetical protein [Saprospiraceae bacterium]MBK9223027.1 hypothetical protein [Saprospiraceae bacterium]
MVPAKLSNRTIWQSWGTMYRDEYGSYYCGPPEGADCGVYSIVGSQQVTNAISSLEGAISSGTTAIATFINGNQVSTLFPNLDSGNLALLQSGDYYLLNPQMTMAIFHIL